jgi:hypothetical protein
MNRREQGTVELILSIIFLILLILGLLSNNRDLLIIPIVGFIASILTYILSRVKKKDK